jgi:Domain of unknown function (DUF5060)
VITAPPINGELRHVSSQHKFYAIMDTSLRLSSFEQVVCISLLLLVSCLGLSVPDQTLASVSQNSDIIPRYELFELSIKPDATYANPFFDVALEATFTTPDGGWRALKGFHYGGGVWKIRFRPDQVGRWTYTYVMTGKGGFRKEGNGTFNSTRSTAEGPVQRHPENPHRWVFANGRPYFPIGLQDCVVAHGSQLPDDIVIDGEGRTDNAGRRISQEEYFSIYGQAGFNLFRFSQQNCSYPLFDDLDHYREAESIATDRLLSLARKHGLRVMFGFFGFYRSGLYESRAVRIFSRILQRALGFQLERPINSESDEILSKEKRFIDYAVARWGVYVDFWELLNEREASDEWTTVIANYVRSVDPDRKPISTSSQKPHLPAIDINAPHWYESESELQSDLRVVEQASEWKAAGKPVIVGEQGNTGMNWDPLSGQRMRIRAWTALFQEISFVFWNTSWSKAGMHGGRYNAGQVANIYLGPEERSYVRVLNDFSDGLDADVRMFSVKSSSPDSVRAYGLFSNVSAGVYLHRFNNHTSTVHRTKITIELPRSDKPTKELIGEWIEPSTGRVLTRVRLLLGKQILEVPPFSVDLALLISSRHGQTHR